MKYVLLLLFLIAGCTSNTEYGDCVGINDTKDIALIYEFSTFNIIVAILAAETIIIPSMVIFNCLECPIGKK